MKFIDKDEKLAGSEEIIRHCIKERLRAAQMQDEAKEIISQANDLFLTVVTNTGVDVIRTDVGTYRMTQTGGKTSFKKEKAQDYLIKKGVDSTLIAAAFKAATSVGKESYSPAFYPARKEE